MLKMLDLLDEVAPSGNPIFLFETETGMLLGANQKAERLFLSSQNIYSLEAIFGNSLSLNGFIEAVSQELQTEDEIKIDDVEAVTTEGVVLPCSLVFCSFDEGKKGMLLIVKLQIDRRPEFTDNLLSRSKRPAFLLDYNEEELTIRQGNQKFYQAFACTADNIEEKYESRFENLLSEDDRHRYATLVSLSLEVESSGILDIPIQTARGDRLLFYYSKRVIKPLIDRGDHCAYCLLVENGETLQAVENPFSIC